MAKRPPNKPSHSGAIKDSDILEQFAYEFDTCWACGMNRRNAYMKLPPELACGRFHHLEIHHIIKPGRSDERPNLARLCTRCHDVVEGHCVRLESGKPCPKITLANVLWLKRQYDGPLDKTRLAALYHRALPRPADIPAHYYTEWLFRSG